MTIRDVLDIEALRYAYEEAALDAHARSLAQPVLGSMKDGSNSLGPG